ncbi:MAG: ABC transporter substrate-binding protein [Flavobacteriales bacterium]|nr:ABC transporter substrate-binding protein [Flavobacteriales bacterium]
MSPKKKPEAEQPESLTTLRVAGVPEPFNLPWQLALERRAFVRAKVELKWRTVPQGTGAMCELLRKGEIDLAVMVTEGAVKDILSGNPNRIVSPFVDTPLTWGVHVGAHTGLRTPEDLKSVPFAISRFNSGSHLMSLAYAKAHGWEPTEKDFIVVNDLAGAVKRLQEPEPAVFLWEKYITASHVHAGTLRRVDEYQPSWPCFVVVARNEVLEEHGDAVQRLLKVVRDQARGLMEKKSAPDMIAQRYGMTVADAKEWFTSVRWNTGGVLDPKDLLVVAETLFSVGMADRSTIALLPMEARVVGS